MPLRSHASRTTLRPAALPPEIDEWLQCPRCGRELRRSSNSYQCGGCGANYPVVDGIPILIDGDKSLFSPLNYVSPDEPPRRTPAQLLQEAFPTVTLNVRGRENFAYLAQLLSARRAKPRVLIVGGRIVGNGTEALLAHDFDFVETDVAFGPRTRLVCDAHDLPFTDGVFDAVVVQGVLCSVVDPLRSVAEMERVLAPGGYVYGEDPFMQQVHSGRFDFNRFTHLGYRRLFREFDEIRSGPVCGPGMALAWAWRYFLLSFSSSRLVRHGLTAFAHLSAFWLKYFDYFLISRRGAFDAASGFFFLGAKNGRTLSDRKLVASYRGAIGCRESA